VTAADSLRDLITTSGFIDAFPKIGELTNQLDAAYDEEYRPLHEARRSAVEEALEAIQAEDDWEAVPEDMRAPLLAPLKTRLCAESDRGAEASCRACRATLAQLESDIAAVPALKIGIITRLQEVTRPKERIERVRLGQFSTEPLDSEGAIDRLVENVKQHLLKLIAEGVRIIIE
jgi:hypothetical protein